MAKSLSAEYVGWFHKYVRKWATWEPGDPVEPGTVGRFDRDLCFWSVTSLSQIGIPCETSPERPVQDRLYASSGGFEVRPQLEAKILEPATGASAAAALTLTCKRKYASLLQVKKATSSHLIVVEDVLDSIKGFLLDKAWPLDWIVVVDRIKARDGFALICSEKGAAIDLRVDAGLGLIPNLEAYGGSVGLGFAGQARGFASYRFQRGATPIFTQAIRVRQALWSRLLRLEPDVLDASGGVYNPAHRPPSSPQPRLAPLVDANASTASNLSHLPVHQRFYNPEASDVPPEELLAMPLAVLFEELDQPMRLELGRSPKSEKDAILRSFQDDRAWLNSHEERQYRPIDVMGDRDREPQLQKATLPMMSADAEAMEPAGEH